MAPESMTDEMIFTEMAADLLPPCDYTGDHDGICQGDSAAWVLHVVPCACGAGGMRLACGVCKDARVASEGGVECDCGYVTVPARLAYSMIEPLR